MIKTFAELKRSLTVGTKIKLVDSSMKNHKFLNITRAVILQQSNAVKFEGGSWLGLGSTGEKASDFTFQENGFTNNFGDGFLKYEFVQ